METKEVKINIPEGYEIDKENSTFECIKFKPIKYINYKDVCDNIFAKNHGYHISPSENICYTPLKELAYSADNAPNKKQLERLLALNQLMNIAYYYNDKQYMRVGYYIKYDKLDDKYFVENLDNNLIQEAGMAAMFIYAKDAKAVIDNPNFRSILDTLCK